MLDSFEQKWLERFSQAAQSEKTNRDQSLFIEGNPFYRDYFLEYSQADLEKGDRSIAVLDVGCGTGSTCRVLAKRGFEVYGVDFSKEIIEVAKKRAEQAQAHLHLQTANIYRLPFPGQTFDIVICNYLFQTVSSPEEVLREAFRVLKSNGKIFIITLNSLSIGRFLLRDDVKLYNPKKFEIMVERLGFKDVRLKGVYIFPKPLVVLAHLVFACKIYRLLNALFFPFFVFFSHSFYLEAKKP